MRDIATKITGGNLPADAYNSSQEESENVVTSADISLDSNAGPDTDKEMLSKAIAGYAGASWAYTDSGSFNDHVVSIGSNLKPPTKYYDNLIVAYVPGNTNTSTTVNVNVSTLGSRGMRLIGGGLPPIGSITPANALILKYNDSAVYFEIMTINKAHDHSSVSEGGDLGSVQADKILLIDAGPVTPVANTQYKDNMCKAWVVFNGTGTPAVLNSFNVDSTITDHGTGTYTFTFKTNFANANICPGGMLRQNTAGGKGHPTIFSEASNPTVSSIKILCVGTDGTSIDPEFASVHFYGDQ